MTVAMILAPVFVQVALTFFLMFWMGSLRTSSIKSGEVKMRDIALRQPNWNESATKVGNSYHSQFEFPVLFYVIALIALFTRTADLIFVVLSWLFVIARLAHCYVHTTSNYVPRRFYVFVFGIIVLLIMWIWIALKIFIA